MSASCETVCHKDMKGCLCDRSDPCSQIKHLGSPHWKIEIVVIAKDSTYAVAVSGAPIEAGGRRDAAAYVPQRFERFVECNPKPIVFGIPRGCGPREIGGNSRQFPSRKIIPIVCSISE
jgi:hypothetical protein